MKTYLGIDLGGTNVRVAKVTSDGEILNQVKGPSYASESAEIIMSNIVTLIKQIPNYEECYGIGIGVPGPVDTQRGVMVLSTNIPALKEFPITAKLTREFNMPVYMDNDANVAGLAEALVGAGKGKGIVYYTTLSTGIGGALIINGKVLSGKHGHAGEIGNMIIDRNRKKISHLNAGSIECEASGPALTRKGKAVLKEEIKHAGDVFALAETGNGEAQKIVEEACADLAVMYSLIAHVADPDCFVIGGGMMKSKDSFLPKVIENFKEIVHEKMRDIEFKEAELEEPGIIGAAMLPISFGK